MAAIDWPNKTFLPQYLLQNGFSQKAKSNIIRTKIPAGLDKVRRRYTTPIIILNGSIQITHAQYLTLENFYNVTLKGGIERFNYIDPADPTSTYEYRFVGEINYTQLGGINRIASFQWERLLKVIV